MLEDRSRKQATCTSSSSSRSMMDELQPPISNKKRKSAAAELLPGQRRRLAKKTKIGGDLAGSYAALSQSPSKSSFNNSPATPSSRTDRIPSGKNAKAAPSTKSNAASQSCDLITPRVSSRVSRPTFKKKASLFERRSPCRPPESDGTPPLSIIPPAPPPSLKRKKSTSSPTKRLAGNNTPSKSKWIDPNPIELTSDDDGNRVQPPQKRVKHTRKKPLSSEVIDLCSESEDVTSHRRTRTRTRDEGSVVVVLSTDEEVDLEFPSFSRLAFRETDTGKLLSLPPTEDESVFQASLHRAHEVHNAPVPKPKAPVAEEDGVMDEHIINSERVDLPRGSLQALYNEALARWVQEPRHAEIVTDQPSPFSYLKCTPPARIIRYTAQSQSPALHTPLFFDRTILRLRARMRLSDDTSLDSMGTSKLNKEQEDTQTDSDTVMQLSVDSETPEVTKTIPIDFQDDVSSDTQVARVSPSIPVNYLDVHKRHVSKAPESPLPLANQESSLPPDTVLLEDTSVPESIQAPRTATPERAKSSAISPNMLCITPSNPSNLNGVNYQLETPQETETFIFRKEISAHQIEPRVLKDAQYLIQALQRTCGTSKITGSSLLPALELNDTAKSSATPNLLSELPVRSTECATITNHARIQDISPQAASSTADALSPDTSMIILTEHITTPKLSSLASSSNVDALSSRDSSPSTRSSQSSDSSASIQSVNCHLVTPDDSPSLLTPPVKAQKQEALIRSNPLPSPTAISFFNMGLSELNLQTLMCNSKFDEDDDDEISVSGMELVYPEEII